MKVSRHARRSVLMEAVESRLMMDATYHNLTGGNFVQSWTNTGLITANDNWAGVPSVIGYLGDYTASTPEDVNPQTLLDGSAGFTQDVIANQSNPNTNITGGVAEFDGIANPTVALQGSGTADAPFLLFHVNASGRQDIRITYNVRDIDGSADNSTQQVALQYRIGDTGSFVNVPAGYIADATTGPNLATLVTPIDVVLPAAVNDTPQVQIRVITTNANASDEWVGIDDINIVSGPLGGAGTLAFSSPTFTVNEDAGTATVTVARTNGSAGTVTVNYSTVAGGTASGGDFTTSSGTLTFLNGDFEESFTVPITNDSSAERHETINLQLTAPGGGAILGSQTTAVLTIVDDDLAQTPGILLNEVSVDQPGAIDTHEYFEVRGPAGASLAGFYFMSVSGEGVESGLADRIVDLHSYTLGSNGLLMVRGASGHAAEDPATTVVTTSSFPNSQAFDNDSNSYILLFSPVDLSSYLIEYVDEDVDGNLDLPEGVVLVDGFGWRDNVTQDAILNLIADLTATPFDPDPVFPVQPPFSPDAASRRPDNDTPLSAAAWYWGDLIVTTGAEKEYRSDRFYPAPFGTPRITPGAVNYGPATVTAKSYLVNGATGPELMVDFSKNVQASLTISDASTTSFKVTDLDTLTDIPAANFAAIGYGAGDVVTLKFTGFSPTSGVLPDGNYRLTIVGANIQDTDGLTMSGNVTHDFYFLQGDANQDRRVTTLDFNFFVANYGLTGRNFSQCNFNYDNIVDSQDFNLFIGHYGRTMPQPPAELSAAPALAASPFSSLAVEEQDDLERLI